MLSVRGKVREVIAHSILAPEANLRAQFQQIFINVFLSFLSLHQLCISFFFVSTRDSDYFCRSIRHYCFSLTIAPSNNLNTLWFVCGTCE